MDLLAVEHTLAVNTTRHGPVTLASGFMLIAFELAIAGVERLCNLLQKSLFLFMWICFTLLLDVVF